MSITTTMEINAKLINMSERIEQVEAKLQFLIKLLDLDSVEEEEDEGKAKKKKR